MLTHNVRLMSMVLLKFKIILLTEEFKLSKKQLKSIINSEIKYPISSTGKQKNSRLKNWRSKQQSPHRHRQSQQRSQFNHRHNLNNHRRRKLKQPRWLQLPENLEDDEGLNRSHIGWLWWNWVRSP